MAGRDAERQGESGTGKGLVWLEPITGVKNRAEGRRGCVFGCLRPGTYATEERRHCLQNSELSCVFGRFSSEWKGKDRSQKSWV